MFKLFGQNFKTTNDCIILATPLVIFASLIGWYICYAVSEIDNIPKFLLSMFTAFIMVSGFSGAWFYMVKKTMALSGKIFIFDRDRVKAIFYLVFSLPKGFGRLFLPMCGVCAIYLILLLLMISLDGFLVSKFIGVLSIDLSFDNIQGLLLSSNELIKEMSELSGQDALILTAWYLIFTAGTSVILFLTMLWIPEIIYTKSNAFVSLYYSVVKVLQNFKDTFPVFLYLAGLSFILTICNTVMMFVPVLYFFVLLFHYYFTVYTVVLLFSYYEREFIDITKY